MLGLLTPTAASWVRAAEENLSQLLADHAHCELKAATSALSLVSRFGSEHPALIAPLAELAAEETAHFRAVCARLSDRQLPFTRAEPDNYVGALWDLTKPERAQTPLLLDRLLVSALIEARSCERFRLLAAELREAELAAFYRGLMESEARHYRLFAGLAEQLFGVSVARLRLSVLAAREAGVADQLPLGPKVHG